MRIASYNIHKAVGIDWRRDPERIVDVLEELNADIVVLQEADRRVGARAGVLSRGRLARDLGYELADLSVRPKSHGWHGNAVLHRNGMQIAKTDRIDIPTVEARGAVSVRFSNPDIEIIGAHLGLTPGMRRKQMAALSARIKNTAHPVVIAGDFNEWKQNISVFDGIGEMVTPGLSFRASRPVAALDRFVLKGPVSHIFSYVHKSDLAMRASDHLPVIMDIELLEQPV